MRPGPRLVARRSCEIWWYLFTASTSASLARLTASSQVLWE